MTSGTSTAVEEHVVVAAPAAEVFTAVADVRRMARWSPEVSRYGSGAGKTAHQPGLSGGTGTGRSSGSAHARCGWRIRVWSLRSM
ncbi:MAG: SRPBCC family protein [Pseudonocardiaceae bacterium]